MERGKKVLDKKVSNNEKLEVYGDYDRKNKQITASKAWQK